MNRAAGAALLALLLGCGNLPTTSDGVAFLEIQPPLSLSLEVGDSLQFVARALDRDGNPLDVEINWRTPDTTISVGTTSGVVTGRFAGSGRIQALIASEAGNTKNPLISDFFTVTVKEPPAALRRP